MTSPIGFWRGLNEIAHVHPHCGSWHRVNAQMTSTPPTTAMIQEGGTGYEGVVRIPASLCPSQSTELNVSISQKTTSKPGEREELAPSLT